jgi:hypothetical protein
MFDITLPDKARFIPEPDPPDFEPSDLKLGELEPEDLDPGKMYILVCRRASNWLPGMCYFGKVWGRCIQDCYFGPIYHRKVVTLLADNVPIIVAVEDIKSVTRVEGYLYE